MGMMGGSVGLAVKKKRLPYRVVGIGRNPSRLNRAKKLGACDEVTTDFKKGVSGADLIIICTNVGEIVSSFKKALPYLKPTAIVTDIGSVKSAVMEGIRNLLSPSPNPHPPSPAFIGGHPLAGTEKKGVENSKSDLYENTTVVLCPLDDGKPALNALSKFWKSLGARPLVIVPEIHDILVAQTSHLPHVLASALVRQISGLNHKDADTAKLLAGSFRDVTRIADSDPRQWAEISASNLKFLVGAIKSYRDILLSILNKIEGSGNPLGTWESLFREARQSRKELLCLPKK